MRLTGKYLRFGGVVLLVGLLGGCISDEKREAKYLESAENQMAVGEYAKARINLRNALQINEPVAETHFLLSQVEQELGDWQAAAEEIRRALVLAPDHLRANIAMGKLFLAARDLPGAREYAEAALNIAPDNAEALAFMALMHQSFGERQEAVARAERALLAEPGRADATSILYAAYLATDAQVALDVVSKSLESNPSSEQLLLMKVGALRKLGQEESVSEAYASLIAEYPKESRYRIEWANYLARSGKPDGALSLLDEAIQMFPERLEYREAVVELVRANQGLDAAIEVAQAWHQGADDNSDIAMLLGNLYVNAQSFDKAEAQFGALAESPNTAVAQPARVKLAELAMIQGQYDRAEELVAKALDVQPNNPQVLLSQGKVNIAKGEYAKAISNLRDLVSKDANSVDALMLLAEAFNKDGRQELALDNYRRVLQLEPDNAIAAYNAGALLAQAQKYEVAISLLESLHQRLPYNAKATNLLAELYASTDQWAEALTLLRKLEAAGVPKSTIDLMIARLALRHQHYNETIAAGERILTSAPQLSGALPLVSQAYIAQEKTSSAIKMVESYYRNYPENDARAVEGLLVKLYTNSGQFNKAVDILTKQVKDDATDVSARVQLASVYRSNGQLSKAQSALEQGISDLPESIALKVELANLYLAKERYGDALSLLQQAHQLQPQSPIIINNLAVVLLDHFPTAENLTWVKDATTGFISSDNAAFLDTRGWLLYRLGEYQQAVTLLEEALRSGGSGADYWYHLGMAYYQNEQLDQAKIFLGRALQNSKAQFFGKKEAQSVYQTL